jgi:NitT/TauT family transport system ATP-binding protein
MNIDRVRIEFQEVSVSFGELTVIDCASFTMRDREFVSIIGPSGCGKTTMMNMVAGFVMPSKGRVLIDGAPVVKPGPERGVIFQDYGVFPWLTVAQNIAFGLTLDANFTPERERQQIVDRYLTLMGLREFRNAYPKTLSGGMRQRLALARAYAVKPQFLLMDEPFGALDAQTRSAMQDLVLQVLAEEEKTVMLITHSVEEAIYLSSRIIVVSARPARILEIIEVPFSYPREASLPENPLFGELRSHIRSTVMSQYAAQQLQSSEHRHSQKGATHVLD